MVRRGITLFVFAFLGVVACSAESKAEKICTADANVFCRCAGTRVEGTKKCKADGATFEACLPCDGTGAGSGAASNANSNPLGRSPGSENELNSTAPTELSPSPASTPTSAATAVPSIPDAGAATPADAGGPPTALPKTDPSFPDAPHCKVLKNTAPKVEIMKIADDATAPLGGKPADGVYLQTWVIDFAGVKATPAATKRFSTQTLQLMGDVGRFIVEDETGKTTAGGFRLTAKSGTKLNIAYECPAAADKDYPYDATDTTLTIYDPPLARVFVRQKETQ